MSGVGKMVMRLVLAAIMVTVAFAQPVGDCAPGSLGRYDVWTRSNKFAKDYNTYVEDREAGKVNYMMRARVESEAKTLFRCECW